MHADSSQGFFRTWKCTCRSHRMCATGPLVRACMCSDGRTPRSQVWQEVTTPTELTAFLNSSQPPPAWPALDSSALNPKLRLVEFYATWCPACKAAAPAMAEVAGVYGQSYFDTSLLSSLLHTVLAVHNRPLLGVCARKRQRCITTLWRVW